MYRQPEPQVILPENFELCFERKLDSQNRWVIMASLIPWAEFEAEYASNFDEQIGAPAKSFRMALGALIIKERLGISDRETVEQIKENPYLQYFIGLSSYSNEAPFEASMLVHFRERIGGELINKINRQMVKNSRESQGEDTTAKKPENEAEEPRKNRGKLIVDASCAPADISYPTDLNLLNQARKHTEKVLDILYEEVKGKLKKKPRTYRQLARKSYLEVAKKRNPRAKTRRKGIKKQLQYIQRNLGHIEQILQEGGCLTKLSKRDYKLLLVVTEIYRQQRWMYQNKTQSIEDRIVSLSQPHVRPIVRGKAGKNVEFGSKLAASCFDGYVFLDKISWDNFNESGYLQMEIEAYYEYTGYYPESVHVDKIYRTRANRAWCQERGIRMSGSPLGRPPKHISKEQKQQAQQDERIRNQIEGFFGQSKRRFSLARVMTKLASTSFCAIAITFLVINLSYLLRQVLSAFLCLKLKNRSFSRLMIIFNYHLILKQHQRLMFAAA